MCGDPFRTARMNGRVRSIRKHEEYQEMERILSDNRPETKDGDNSTKSLRQSRGIPKVDHQWIEELDETDCNGEKVLFHDDQNECSCKRLINDQ